MEESSRHGVDCWPPRAERGGRADEAVDVIARILCPLTLSDVSTHTFEHALAMARFYGANVIALHVFARWIPPLGLGTYPGWMRQVPEARTQIEQELDDLLAPAKQTDLHVRLTISEGDPAREILESAAALHADLIVLGAHVPRRFERFRHESIGEAVIRRATCPVMVAVARELPSSPPFVGYRQIVAAMDFSDHSRDAVTYAISIAEHSFANVTLVYVVEGEDAPNGLVNAGPGQAGARFETAEGLLRAAAKAYDRRVGGITCIVRRGAASQEVIRLVHELEGDLLVMGVRGARTAESRRLGSTTSQILKCAPCTVLAVPEHQRGPTL